MRIEEDSIGSLNIPDGVYYGVQSLRAKQNFDITGVRTNSDMIISLAQIKKAAAASNYKSGKLGREIYAAIDNACDEIIDGGLHEFFIVDPIQGGAGTSANMNMNEIIANRAIELLGGEKGDYSVVHPNDHVNMCQSTNDVYPTAGKLTALKLIDSVLPELLRLQDALYEKAVAFKNITKVGRTQLQDAVPMKLGQCFQAYFSAVDRDTRRIRKAKEELLTINLGGTAIGTAINADKAYLDTVIGNLEKITGYPFQRAEDLIDGTQNIECFVAVSGALKACAVTLSKMSNDLRLLSSGPKTGIGEINLPAKQNGSSIMPGKVNPVIPEVVSQVAFNIIGNDCTITMAAEAGQLELNAFEPVLLYKLFESITTLRQAAATLTDNCVEGITANEERCEELFENSIVKVTALCPYIGYKKAAELAKQALYLNIPVSELMKKKGIEKLNHVLDFGDMSVHEGHKKAIVS